jgi:HupF/HypC family.
MCLAIPMQIESIDGFTARCQAKGVWRDVSLFMMQDTAGRRRLRHGACRLRHPEDR